MVRPIEVRPWFNSERSGVGRVDVTHRRVAAWQLFILLFAFLMYANLFSDYGVYSHPVVDSVAAVVFLLLALFIGTWLPVSRWRSERRGCSEDGQAD
jgi:hypothetical protein